MSRIKELYRRYLAGQRPTPPDPQQQPSLYVPGLRAKPWHDAGRFPWVAEIERAAETIGEEFSQIERANCTMLPYVDPTGPGPDLGGAWGTRYIHDQGEWSTFYLEALDRPFIENQRLCPGTMRALQGVPRRTTSAFFSVLGPKSHIPAHFGPSNAVLRVHFGVRIPRDCRMRVGSETRRWQEGRCTIFDDSFDHEVWNASSQQRVVLIFYILHPDLTDEEVSELETIRRDLRIDEQTGFRQMVDAMIEGRLPLPLERGPGRLDARVGEPDAVAIRGSHE